MSYSEKDHVQIEACKHWIGEFVIALNICPFAGESYRQDRIDYKLSTAEDEMSVYQSFLEQLQFLIANPKISNAFLILPKLHSFEVYLQFYDACEQLLQDAEVDQFFQLASFHPDYQYEGLTIEDPANYRNRSPYPMIHILRAGELEKAIESYGNTLEIPEINSQKLRDLGIEAILKITKANN